MLVLKLIFHMGALMMKCTKREPWRFVLFVLTLLKSVFSALTVLELREHSRLGANARGNSLHASTDAKALYWPFKIVVMWLHVYYGAYCLFKVV